MPSKEVVTFWRDMGAPISLLSRSGVLWGQRVAHSRERRRLRRVSADVVHLPRIVVTLADLVDHPEPERAARRAALYLDAVRRHGGEPVPIDVRTPPEAMAEVLAGMDGLLLTGGGDIDPARYGQPNEGSRDIDQPRDAL